MTMDLELSEQAYLIAWDDTKQRMIGRTEHPAMVSAAVLIDLWLDGALSPDDDKHASPTGRPAGAGPGRAQILARIAESKPRAWKYWVGKGSRASYRAVRGHLAKDRVIRVEERRFLGIPAPPRVTVRNPRVARELVERCRRAVLHGVSPGEVPVRDAALVAIVAAAELDTVFSGRERRAHRDRIAELTLRAGPAAKALRSVVTEQHTSNAGG
jgi:hypothetical protein